MATYLHQNSAVVQIMHFLKLSIKLKRTDAGTVPSKGAIWKEFSEHQSIKKT